MNEQEAFEIWNSHLDKWIEFLNVQAQSRNEDKLLSIKIGRQLRSLYDVKMGVVANPHLLKAFIYPEEVGGHAENGELLFFQEDLNDNQRDAVKKALSTEDLMLIQGPPGTGKTKVITEICFQLLNANPEVRILICSETHVAVNNVLERVAAHTENVNMIRIRNNEEDASQDVVDVEMENYLTDYYQQLIAAEVDSETISDIHSLFTNPRNKLDLEKELILSATICGITCNGIGAFPFDPADQPFDYCIIDEVCKATLPEILMPMMAAQKAILVGDPKQLPPLFCIEDTEILRAIDGTELEKYKYIDDVFQRIPIESKAFLDQQFRMTNEIGNLVSRYFYNNELRNGLDRGDVNSLQWVNYKPTKRWPALNEDGTESHVIFNDDEVEIVLYILDLEYEKANPGNKIEVAVIAPYRPMIRSLNKAIRKRKYGSHFRVLVDTVDAFQGKDAEIVIFCITRTAGTMRFFSDFRRLNVALSRAKNKLWLIGARQFTDQNRVLRKIADEMNMNLLEVEKLGPSGSSLKQEDDSLETDVIQLSELVIPSQTKENQPDPNSIRKWVDYYKTNGKFIKPLQVEELHGTYILLDGYSRYLAALELGLDEIEVNIVDVYVY